MKTCCVCSRFFVLIETNLIPYMKTFQILIIIVLALILSAIFKEVIS